MAFVHNPVLRLFMVLCTVLMGVPAATASSEQADTPSDQTIPSATDSSDDARETLVLHLVERGASEADARLVVKALNDEDVRVLSENPRMLTPAGDSTLIAWVILLAAIITGFTVLIVANST